MTFDTQAPRNPVAVKALHITLTVREKGDGTGNAYTGAYDFHVLDAEGNSLSNRTGDLVPHLTAGQKTALVNFLDSMLTKAQGAVG